MSVTLEVPHSIAMDNTELVYLEFIGKEIHETALQVVYGGIAFAAIWGVMIEEADKNPEFRQGCFTKNGECIELFDIPHLIRLGDKTHKKREQARQELGVDASYKHFFTIDDSCREPLEVAADYYQQDPKRLMSLAMILRARIISHQQNGFYGFLPDGITLVPYYLKPAPEL